jgi:hypothetical protein
MTPNRRYQPGHGHPSRRAAAKALDEANEATRSYIQQNDVAEVGLAEFDEENQ